MSIGTLKSASVHKSSPLGRKTGYKSEWRSTLISAALEADANLCRDSEKEGRNLQKTSATDGSFWRCKVRSGTVIEPISNPRPLPNRQA